MGDRERARRVIGYDAFWDAAAVIDSVMLERQARELAADVHVHPEHYRWAMWCGYVAAAKSRPLEEATLEALLMLDTHEASRAGGFGHGIVLDLADHFALTEAQFDRLEQHPTANGFSSNTSATLARKIASRRASAR